MRVRRKSWTQNELDTCTRLITPNSANKGLWSEYFGNNNDIHAEIGCGKGRWITQSAALCPDCNFIALERQRHVIVSGMRASKELEPKPAFVVCDADELLDVFAAAELKRLYINFCDPWPRPRWQKRRLTHRGFLEIYETILCPCGGLFFKTDNLPLFDWSLSEFKASRWIVENVSRNLYGDGVPDPCLMTEYEEKFFMKGMPIYRCEAYTRD